MTSVEGILFWCAILFYLVGSCCYLFATVFRKPRFLRPAAVVVWAAFVFHTITAVVRWRVTGHAPVMRNYENALAGGWVIVLLFLLMQHFSPRLAAGGMSIIPFVLLMLGYGALSEPQLEPLTPPFQSAWLWVHVLFAWLAYGSFVLAFALGILYLVRDKRGEEGLAALDELQYRLVACGFVSCTIMIVAGCIWANRLWGSYWSWDPIETWSLVSWLIYGFYLHLRLFFKWRGRRSAIVAVIGLVSVVVAFWGVNFMSRSLHVFGLL